MSGLATPLRHRCLNDRVDAEAEALVLAWADAALAELAEADFAQIDIDQLFDPPPEFGARAALQCLELAVHFARQTLPRVGGFVVLPLGWEEAPLDLTRAIPDLSSVLSEPTTYAPGVQVPGIYLVQPWLVGHSADGEEYVRTLQSDQLSDNYVSYYRAGRSSQEIEDGWEFARDIFIRTVPVRG